MRLEPGNGRLSVMGVPPGAAISEPAHVPSNDSAHGGWLLMVVDIPNGPPGVGPPHDYSSELWIVEADEVEKGPIARVKTGLALRSQVHGAWVGRAKLEQSKLR
jgi:carotenoid cleavage dioxygenase-like enzyme